MTYKCSPKGGSIVSKKIKISDSELEVMQALWKIKKGTSSEIIAAISNTWSKKTIQTLISRLVSKDVIGVDKSNQYVFTYYPLISENDYKSLENSSFLEKLYDGSLAMMVSTIIKNKNASDDDIEELKKILNEE
nr:BlaI/MecI/CopY family transcriptional regulator [Terrisporobacter muris]